MAVNRPSLFNVFAVALFVLAGSAETAWEFAHALNHQHAQGESGEGQPAVPEGVHLETPGHGHGHDHDHLVLRVTPRTPVESFTSGPALPATAAAFRADPSFMGMVWVTVTAARAGPDPGQSSQPRAPPLL